MNKKISNIKNQVSRRDFIKSSAFLGGATVGSSLLGFGAFASMTEEQKKQLVYTLRLPENQIYSACLQCHNSCSIKGKTYNGLLAKIDGNPYGPQNMLPNIDYKSALSDSAPVDGKVCPKGQAGIQTVYDPYRIKKVLKRAGKRGENNWVTIDFDKAITEIVNGGDLFGEGHVKGFREVRVLTDPKLSKEMASDSKAFGKGKITLATFKKRHAGHLDVLIDPNHPDLGPKNNRFIMMCGRIEHGRKELGKRFTLNAMGSNNFFEHTTICEQSHHIGHIQVTNKWVVADGKGKWAGGKEHLKPDLLHSEFVIFFGTGAFEANFGKTSMAQKVTDGIVDRNFKMAVVDPRMSKTAAKAKWWVPVKPGSDAAFAWALIRSIMENKRYDESFLSNANMAAAHSAGEKSISDAPLLVVIEEGRPSRFLRASDLGIGKQTEFVCLVNGKAVKVDVNDKNHPQTGDLFVNTKLKGFQVKSSLQLIRDEAFSKPLGEWASICEVEPRMIHEIATEFTSHGKKAACDLYRGAVQHTNGYYNAVAIIYLNMLIGNIDWLGGLQSGGGHWHEDGSHKGYFNFKSLHPNKLSAFGPPITREKSKYEDTSLFREQGYPAKRNWYPYTGNIYQEIIPSAEDKYPYGIDILFLHQGTPLLSTPGGVKAANYFSDPKRLPLFITDDIVIGETSMYSDYIFPDVTYLERWGTPHTTPDVAQKASKVRQPMIQPIPELVTVYGEKMPSSLEAVYLAIAEKLGLPGFGKDGFAPGMDFTRPEDWYLKFVANIAKGDHENDEVPLADEGEMELFTKARRHFTSELFNPERWKKSIGNDDEIWKRIVYVLNRGGRFGDFKSAYTENNYNKGQLKGQMKFFIENVALGKNSLSGLNYHGIGQYTKIADMSGMLTNFEKLKKDEFYLSTYKEVFGGQSRTIGNYWSQIALKPVNVLFMNRADANRLGLNEDDWVTMVSDSDPTGTYDLHNGKILKVKARLQPIEGLKPNVVTISWHYGHWAYGGNDVRVDNHLVKGDIRRKDTACPNPVMAIDTGLKNMCLTDPIGGSASFLNTKVRIVKI